jgi:hypothetical protein
VRSLRLELVKERCFLYSLIEFLIVKVNKLIKTFFWGGKCD